MNWELNIILTNFLDNYVKRKEKMISWNQFINCLQEIRAQPSSIGSILTSCGDLQTIGFVNSGIYSILVNKQVQNVYCDFTKSGSAGIASTAKCFAWIKMTYIQTDFQKLIGIVDVKSTQVYFYAQMSSPGYSTTNTTIPFDVIKFNVGVAYSATGVFVASTSGIYYFAVTAFSASYENQIDFQTKTAGTTNSISVPHAAQTTFYTTRYRYMSTLLINIPHCKLNKGDQFRFALL